MPLLAEHESHTQKLRKLQVMMHEELHMCPLRIFASQSTQQQKHEQLDGALGSKVDQQKPSC
jgi:hypothetical protein